MRRSRIIINLLAGIFCLTLLSGCSSSASGMNDQGVAAFEQGSYAEALSCFEKAIVEDNQNSSYQVNKGMACLALGDYDNAHSSFDTALRLADRNSKAADRQLAYRGIGITYMEEEDYESALQAFSQALECRAGHVGEVEYDILMYRAETQTRMGDYSDAVDTYTVLLEAQGESPQLYYLRGAARVKGGDLEQGTEDMDTAVADSSDYDMYLNCYYCLSDSGFAQEGVRYLREALTISETSASHKTRGIIDFLLEDYSAALAEFESFGSNADPDTLIYMGMCYQALGNDTNAYEVFSEALEKGGQNSEVYYQMGMCMFRMEEYEEALSYLTLAKESEDTAHYQEILYTEGICHERLADYQAALSDFQSYVSLYGSTPELDREITFLKTR